MILIGKPAARPPRLSRGVARTRTNCNAFEAEPGIYIQGGQKFSFDRGIYGHSSVKRALQTAQHNKCCYCEGLFIGHAAGDVEHYRPKDGAQQDRTAGVQYPGYYWLAYDWANLYFSCEICNRVHKRRFFP